jgi:hypothetical protein
LRYFVEQYDPPSVGFASFDLYSSTGDALAIFRGGERRMLRQVSLYFDEMDFIYNHRFAGELLATDEFNDENEAGKIDKWCGVSFDRPFPERSFLSKLFVAHDLEAVSRSTLDRESVSYSAGLTVDYGWYVRACCQGDATSVAVT